MLDHPSWLVGDDGTTYRAVRSGPSIWSVVVAGDSDIRIAKTTGSGQAPVLDVLDPASLTGPKQILAPLQKAGPVGRLRNPDLWDALATSVVRQVIRAVQARKLYRAFCREHGEHVSTSAGDTWLFPKPDAVLALPEVEFARLGMTFKRHPLRNAAEAYLEFGGKWSELDAPLLLTELQTVPRIGPWTAGATVADVTNDYALYPLADLAVRTWVKRLAPERTWPDTEPEFARVWQRLAGDQLSEWALLTLAWGVRHASGVAV
jgi:DNA-3-methyladenine glycosylase II